MPRSKVNVFEVASTDTALSSIQSVLDRTIKCSKQKASPQPGDLIVNTRYAGYRMQGIYMIGLDGKVTHLDYDHDDYGCIHPTITVPDIITPSAEFDTHMDWHNNMVPVDLTKFTYDRQTYKRGRWRVHIATYDTHVYALMLSPKIDIKARRTIYMEVEHAYYESQSPNCIEYLRSQFKNDDGILNMIQELEVEMQRQPLAYETLVEDLKCITDTRHIDYVLSA